MTLGKELEFLKRYLEIEQIRFGKRLTVQMDIAPDTLDAQVPNLILQPLVENAIRHGIEPHAKPGRIELRSKREADVLTLEVCDNGVGISPNKSHTENVGLSNTRARLEALHAGAHSLEFLTAPGGGLLVRMTIPFRSASKQS